MHAEKKRKGAFHEPGLGAQASSPARRRRSQSLPRRFMVPMHAEKGRKRAFHERWLVWSSAFRRLEPFGPAEAGTPSVEWFHSPNMPAQNHGGFPDAFLDA